MAINLETEKKIADILDFVNKNDNYLLTAHVNADGDAIASVLAFSLFLDRLNKTYSIILHDQKIEEKYRYLKNWEKIISFNESDLSSYKNKINVALIFDSPGDRRIGDVASIVDKKNGNIKIDHHPSETDYSALDWVDTSASSVASMVFEIINASDIDIDKNMAEAIYTGIVYDTGRLSFSNTRTKDLEICANMVDLGVEPGKITNNLFFDNSAHSLKVIGIGLSNITQFCDGRVSLIPLFEKDMENVDPGDIEVLANHSVSVRNTEVGVFVREREPGFFKLSLRSKEYVDVSKIAGQLDGGGHKRASGCRFTGSYDELIKKLIPIIEKEL
ncbi:MAG: bifunctional oligoribonuclease/PAP phosphatase NrnA [Calditrichaeota bacterium]|nr:MAG: bifunctional oligoribonuclease/PAP phosphatase NrnA [Calditrichota bacterium]MBL1206766.1 bifunctional oligoribonuclease/PAP phosphatase NrnA [Calditrichota bacterium]NOG46592.1 bifunctional oligoribonuclease/PAP phosphatase NrnA [Calditrichota bacterium]